MSAKAKSATIDPKALASLWTEDAVRLEPGGDAEVGLPTIGAEDQKEKAERPSTKMLAHAPAATYQASPGAPAKSFDRSRLRGLEFVNHPAVVWVLALSGGYCRHEGNQRLARNLGIIASFSQGLLEGLTAQQSDADFNSVLDGAVESIYQASTAGFCHTPFLHRVIQLRLSRVIGGTLLTRPSWRSRYGSHDKLPFAHLN